ncbi:hypothetical protein B0I35DRAFT_98946 [Stachybotrys elegans]|uniref:Azaphilone pigments biosynthesis cluster protein L N-terminal domain-containing protein n=1 Tax=Stachybotrys elegans TaxID=80388 RepID=A0A8K0SHZ2_9HYPO|nr:hypothetical protein B0I35DRAFT_98946 [Stachybotrys elegans]
MADPLSITSGVIAIVTFTIQSSTALYHAIESFKTYPKRVAELKTQLWALIDVLKSLEALSREDVTACRLLESPLKQCGKACQEFKCLLEECRRSSTSGRLSLSEWMRLRYRNGDIITFMESIESYKSTISIAIADTNLRTSKVTLSVLNDYKSQVDATTQYLEEHLEEVLSRLDGITQQAAEESLSGTTNMHHMTDEKTSTEKCLQICRQFQADLNKMQFQLAPSDHSLDPHSSTAMMPTRSMTFATAMTLSGLKACDMEMTDTVSKLLLHREKTNERLLAEPMRHMQDETEAHEVQVQRLQHELDGVKQLLDFCKDASSRAAPSRVHVLENISVKDGSQQICVSSVGDLFNINGATAGSGSLQLFGSMPTESLHNIIKLHKSQQETDDREMIRDVTSIVSGSKGSI